MHPRIAEREGRSGCWFCPLDGTHDPAAKQHPVPAAQAASSPRRVLSESLMTQQLRV